MAELADLLADAIASELAEELEPIEPETFGELSPEERAELLPLSERQRLARTIAADEGIRYSSAMRRLQRYVTAGAQRRRPAPAVLDYLAGLRGAAALAGADVLAIIRGQIRVSEELRRRSVRAVIPAERMAPVIADHVAGRHDAAAEMFAAAFRSSYSGVPLEFENLESVELYPQ